MGTAVIAGAACTPASETIVNSPGTSYRLPWIDASGEYSLQDILLPTFHEPDKLRGGAAEIIVNPRVEGAQILGEEPIGRWVRNGSSLIPADATTLQAATLYAHIEKLTEIDRATGLAKFLIGRERVGLLALISDGSSTPAILNNAVYDGRLDALFVVPYSPGEGLNIALNGGIIGHEHFHRVFQAIMLNPIREAARNGTLPLGWSDPMPCAGARPEDDYDMKSDIGRLLRPSVVQQLVPSMVFNQVLLRGVNEGFADFWGWAYSTDDNFVGRSLGSKEDTARRLDVPSQALPLKAALKNSLITTGPNGLPVLKSEGGRVAVAYRFGTEYARILRGLVEALVQTGRYDRADAITVVRASLAASLSDVSKTVLEKWGREELHPELMLKPALLRLTKADGSRAVCGELLRMKASTTFTEGICGNAIAPIQSLEP